MKPLALIVGLLLSPMVQALSMIAWNVAEFSDHNPERLQRLLILLRERSPDVVLLQEVEKQTLLLARKPSAGFTGYRIGSSYPVALCAMRFRAA